MARGLDLRRTYVESKLVRLWLGPYALTENRLETYPMMIAAAGLNPVSWASGASPGALQRRAHAGGRGPSYQLRLKCLRLSTACCGRAKTDDWLGWPGEAVLLACMRLSMQCMHESGSVSNSAGTV